MKPSLRPSRTATIASFRETGGRIAAVLPVHYPRALFRAHGLLPVEVWGPPGARGSGADAHLQAYTCSIVRAALSFILAGKLDVVDVIVVPHACDSLQGLGSLLMDLVKPQRPVLPLYMPRGDGEPATAFLAAELERLSERLAAATAGEMPEAGTLLSAVQREEAADAAVGRLWAVRRRLPLGNRALFDLLRTREYLPAEDFIALADATLERQAASERRGVPVILSGIVPEPMEVLDALDQAGGLVVGDDFACSGRRVYPRGLSDAPFRRMAERLLGGPPDSTRGSAIAARADHLGRLCTETGARAVLFYTVKFCEPELFYFPLLRAALERRGIRTFIVEADISERLPQQVVTRVEALLETIA